jgi:hypothetical protein
MTLCCKQRGLAGTSDGNHKKMQRCLRSCGSWEVVARMEWLPERWLPRVYAQRCTGSCSLRDSVNMGGRSVSRKKGCAVLFSPERPDWSGGALASTWVDLLLHAHWSC